MRCVPITKKRKRSVMKFRKGQIIKFSNREETIIKGSSDRLNGMVKTKEKEYSVDFLCRWLDFGFIEIINKVK